MLLSLFFGAYAFSYGFQFCFPHLMMYFSLDTLLLAGASVAVCSALCLRILPAGRD